MTNSPDSRSMMCSDTSPILVVSFDCDNRWPDFIEDVRYQVAWVICWRKGAPRAMVAIDLGQSRLNIEMSLRSLAAQVQAMPVTAKYVPSDDELPPITVIVPSIIERIDDVERCIAQLAQVDYPNFEVVIVDNRREIPDRDPLPEFVRDRPDVRVVRQSKPGISAARNAGVAATTAPIVAFTDDDVQVDNAWLRAIGTRFVREPGLDAVSGLILPLELETPAQIFFERYYGGFGGERTFSPVTLAPETRTSSTAHASRFLVKDEDGQVIARRAVYGVGGYVAGANMAFRRSVLSRVGGFDEALGTGTTARGGEDLAAMIDVLWGGGQIGFEPSAVVHHRHRRGYEELLRQLDGNGIGFTAMLTSLIIHDPRHLFGIGARLPRAASDFSQRSIARITKGSATKASGEPSAVHYSRELVHREYRGYLRGPGAYLRSRRKAGR